MQKVYFLLIVLLSLIFIPRVNASHLMGGEVSWECLTDGRYIFKAQVYVECKGTNLSFNYLVLDIRGNPLPTDTNNNTISWIRLKPDSSKWNLNQQGDKNPKCGFNNVNSNNLSCANGDIGTIRLFYYRSDTIILNGTPPQSGWDFELVTECCMSDRDNVSNITGKRLSLRSIMYPNAANQAIDSCYDSSPEFAQAPWSTFCRGDLINLSVAADDPDFDSIIYSFDTSHVATGSNIFPVNYVSGYSYSSPTPDITFHPSNVASTLNPNTGILNFKINNGIGESTYQIAIKADSYRDGVKIASVINERIVKLMDCPLTNNSQPNSSPIIFMGQSQGTDLELNVKAGDLVSLPISINDTDMVGTSFQSVRSTFSSIQFSADFVDTAACLYPPCAILKNQTPSFDTLENEYAISGLGSLVTTFEWQTDCSHILDGDSVGVYHFYLNTQDDYCPIPDIKDAYLKVVVEPLASNGIQNANNTLFSLDTVDQYQWLDCITDSMIVGANSATFTPSQNGSYAVILQNGSCIDTSDCYVYTTVGVNENNFQNEINFYPNPSNGLVNIELAQKQESLQIKVRNIHGQLVQEEQFVNQSYLQLQLNGKPGIYFIELVNGNGERANVKVVKR